MMNTFCGIGRIANDLQLKKTSNGKSVLAFSLAVDKRNKKKLEEQNMPGTNFIQCVAWNNTAETIAAYFKKGSQIGISGSVETRSYKHPQHDEVTVYVTEILVENITFIDKKEAQPQATQFETVDDVVENNAADLLPF